MTKKDIRKLKANPDNPRTMSEFMEGKLIESILVFPKARTAPHTHQQGRRDNRR